MVSIRRIHSLRALYRSTPYEAEETETISRYTSGGGGAAPWRSFERDMRGVRISEALKGEAERDPAVRTHVKGLASRIFVTFTFPTVSGHSTLEFDDDSEAAEFVIAEKTLQAGVHSLRAAGFSAIAPLTGGLSAAGDARTISNFLQVDLSLKYADDGDSAPDTSERSEPFDRYRLFIAPHTSVVRCPDDSAFEYATFAPPLRLAHELPTPPTVSYHSPASSEIASLLNVPTGLTGADVTVAIVDTGFYRHKCFDGYSYQPVKTRDEPAPDIDDRGHGTAMAWNVFAVAPQARVLGYKFTVPGTEVRAFKEAVDGPAQIICCAWCFTEKQAYALTVLRDEIRRAIKRRKIVIFAVGNRPHKNVHVLETWPASMPAVIAVGGIHADRTGALQKSNLSNEFVSNLYPGRSTPDVCGLCGLAPHGIYFVLPTQPRSDMDQNHPGRPHPDHDETSEDDGWWGGSGTSSATAQLGGVAALLIQAARQKAIGHSIDQALVQSILRQSAVQMPQSSYGLANVAAAIRLL